LLKASNNSKGWSNVRSKESYKKTGLTVAASQRLTVFPYMILHFDVGRIKSIKALEEAMINNQLIFLVAQRMQRMIHPDRKIFIPLVQYQK